MKKSKRPFFFCALCAVLGMAASCGDGSADIQSPETKMTDASTETAAVTENELQTQLSAFQTLDFGGAEFRISTLDRNSYEIYSETENGDVCNDAVYSRNRMTEETLNLHIVPVLTETELETDHESQINNITRAVQAGEDYCDIAALFVYRAGTPIINGIFQSWKDIPHVDFSKPWWSGENETFSVTGKQYIAVGDLAVTTMLMTYGTFFNKRLVEAYDIPNLYETVYDGAWTIDCLHTYATLAYADLNGNGEKDAADQFGYTGEMIINSDVMLTSFDQHLIEMGKDGIPHVIINTPRTVKAVEKVYALFHENTGSYMVDTWTDELPIFAEGRAMFITTYLDNAFHAFRDMEDEYGILPFPKLDEAQAAYKSDARDQYSVLCIPQTATQHELIGAATEVMNLISHYEVYPAYYETALKTKYVSDTDSMKMIDLLMAGRNFDFSILHGGDLNKLPYIVRQLMTSKSKDFASAYAKLESSIEKSLENWLRHMRNCRKRSIP